MGMELEAAGDMLAAGLTAHAIEGPGAASAGADHEATHSHTCANCQAPVQGKFCGNCGQSAHLHRSVLHLGEELLHGLLHFDAKGWRTLPLLVFRPGQLTRRYIDGQRTRFVSPLALFLFMVFLMFFVFSLTSHTDLGKLGKTADTAQARTQLAESLAKANAGIAKAQAALDRARAAGAETTDAMDDLADATALRNSTQEAIKALDAQKNAVAQAEKAGKVTHFDADFTGNKWQVNTPYPWLNQAILHAGANPELALYKLKNAASKYSFLLVPISMPFLWLMFFWRRGITMYDHAVFTLYSLCFMALLMSVVALSGAAGWGGLAGALIVFAPPLHMFAQLRGTYGVSRLGALWRTCALLVVAAIVLALYTVAVLALSAG